MDTAFDGAGGVGSDVATGDESWWRRIGERVDADLRIPDIHGERCVHAIVEQAGCRACVDACPRGAWMLDDEGLDLDTDACDGCGLCTPACPQGAIRQEREVLHGNWRGRRVAAIACEHAGVRPGAGVLPCLHTLGERELLRLRRAGVTHLVSCRGDCNQCPRHGGATLRQHLERVNRVLGPRRGGGLHHTETDVAHWQHLADSLSGAAEEGPALSRRALFRIGIDTSVRLFSLYAEEEETFLAPGELLGEQCSELPLPHVPSIDAERCNACHACARLCPQGAIELVEDQAGGAYRLHSVTCTGCGICSDSCDRDAVRVDAGVRPTTDRVPLYRGDCRSCGVSYLHAGLSAGLHSGAEPDNRSLCTICSQTAHHRQLFQVY